MTDQEFDTALVEAAFTLGAEKGFAHVSPAAAARHAGLDFARARERFGCTAEILRRFGHMADAAALTGVPAEGSTRDKLFDILLRRFDFLQAHRAGVLALLRYAPLCPPLGFALLEMNLVSMGWLLEGAGVDATGLMGAVKKRGLLLVWGRGARAWAKDESEDLVHTMAAVDNALTQAESLAARLGKGPEKEAASESDSPSNDADAAVE